MCFCVSYAQFWGVQCASHCYSLVCILHHFLQIPSRWFILKQQDYFTCCSLCRDCEASCCFSASPLSIKTSNSKHDLTALRRSQTVVVLVIFISGRSLCISPLLCSALLIFLLSCLSVFLCLFLMVWQCDSGSSSVLCGDVSRREMSVLAPLIAQCVGACQWLCDLDTCVCLCVVYEICSGAYSLLLMRVWVLTVSSNLSLCEMDKYLLWRSTRLDCLFPS